MAAPFRCFRHSTLCLLRKHGHTNKIRPSYYFSYSTEQGDNESAPTAEPRVFTGIQPTGVPHLGNYVGAINQMVKLQRKYKGRMLLSVVDLHALSVQQDPHLLRNNILDMTACLLACGINPEETILFQQSMVPQHTELAWILFCTCSVPRLQRMTQWKEKKAKIKEPSVGLLTYPILQAADILLYKASVVPVGEDQTQHIELTRDLARAFNQRYGHVFPECSMLVSEVPKIRSLRNPSAKMSKSEPSNKSRIELTDTPQEITKKIRKAITDFTSEVTYDPVNRPGVSNLIDIHLAVSPEISLDEILEESFLLAEDTALYKKRLASVVAESLAPVRGEMLRLQGDRGYLVKVLDEGRERAVQLAEETLDDVKQKLGLR